MAQVTLYKDVTNITFNRFFASMVGYLPPLGEGWYRIEDYRTTGYLLDRVEWDANTKQFVYGCDEKFVYEEYVGPSKNNLVNTLVEPLIVHVTQLYDPKLDVWYNRHNHRVYSEIHPEDEIYWTWDWGYQWTFQRRNPGFYYPTNPETGDFEPDVTIARDAAVFGMDPLSFDRDRRPLASEEDIDPNIPSSRVGPDYSDRYDSDPMSIYFNYWRGFIYSRTDTSKNIKASFDWRSVWYVRYSSQGLYDSWIGGDTAYSTGDVTLASDGWLYVCVSPNSNCDPTLYDAYNQPYAQNVDGDGIYPWTAPVVPEIGAAGGGRIAPPTNAFAPTSMRRAWMRLWPETYKWFSPWSNTTNAKGSSLMGYPMFIGTSNLAYTEGAGTRGNNYVTQPLFSFILANIATKTLCRPISGDDDEVTFSADVLSTNYYDTIEDIDFGSKSYSYETIKDSYAQGDDGFWTDRPEIAYIINKGEAIMASYDTVGELGFINPKGEGLYSHVTDNRIVYESFDPRALRPPVDIGPLPDTASRMRSSYVSGKLKNIKFGNGSHGNTIYAVPMVNDYRRQAWDSLTKLIEWLTKAREITHNLPFTHLYYGWGWRIPDEMSTSSLGVIPLDWPVKADVATISRMVNVNDMESENSCFYGDVDFGENFIGNVFFGAMKFTTFRNPLYYPYIDNAYLSSNMDGALSQTKFGKQNLYNIFLHGLSRCNIESSISNIFEGLYHTNIKQSNYSLFRDVYWSNFEISRHNSVYHSLLVNQTGVFAHNYLDNFVNSTVRDSFTFNVFSMQEKPAYHWGDSSSLFWPGEFPYFQNFSNDIGTNFTNNIFRGFTYLSTFGNWVYWNRPIDDTSSVVTGFVNSDVRSHFVGNTLPASPIYFTDFQSRSCQGLDWNSSSLLPGRFAKEVKAGNSGFAIAASPIMISYDEFTGFPNIYPWGSAPYPTW